LISEMIGWFFWSIMALAGTVLIYGAIVDSINEWRWKRACKRGEIKPFSPETIKAQYLASPRTR
jgi:hypothetical protein